MATKAKKAKKTTKAKKATKATKKTGKGGAGAGRFEDPALSTFEKALAALGKENWEQAAAHFEKAIEKSESASLAERARVLSRVAARHLERAPKRSEVDPFAEAVFEKNRGELRRALDLCKKHEGKGRGRDARFVYLRASVHALSGDAEAALEALEQAIGLDEVYRVQAHHDPDFESLHERDAFTRLLESR